MLLRKCLPLNDCACALLQTLAVGWHQRGATDVVWQAEWSPAQHPSLAPGRTATHQENQEHQSLPQREQLLSHIIQFFVMKSCEVPVSSLRPYMVDWYIGSLKKSDINPNRSQVLDKSIRIIHWKFECWMHFPCIVTIKNFICEDACRLVAGLTYHLYTVLF